MSNALPKPKRGWGIVKKKKLQPQFYDTVASVVCNYDVKRANATLRRMYAEGKVLVPVELRPVDRGGCGWLTHYRGEWIYDDTPDKTRARAWNSALIYFGLIAWGLKGERARERFDANAIELLKSHGVGISRVEMVAMRGPGRRNPVLKSVRKLRPSCDRQAANWCRRAPHPDLEFVPDDKGRQSEEIRYRGFRIGRIFQPWPECDHSPVYGFSLPGLIWDSHKYDQETVYGWDLKWKTPAHCYRQVRWILEPKLEIWEQQRATPHECCWEEVEDSVTAEILLCCGQPVARVVNLVNAVGKLSGEWHASLESVHKGAGVVWRFDHRWSKSFRSLAKAQAWCEQALQDGLSRPPLWRPACVHPVEVWEQPEQDCYVRVTMPDRHWDGRRYQTKKELGRDVHPDSQSVDGAVWLIPLSDVVDGETEYHWGSGEWNEEPLDEMSRDELRGLVYANGDPVEMAREQRWEHLKSRAIFVSGCTGADWDPPDDKLWAVLEAGGKLDLVTVRTPREQRQVERVLWSDTDPETW